jgi:release factor glutamine methyltransferase
MTIADWLKRADEDLLLAGIATSRLDAVVLMEDELSKNRAWLLANQDTKLSSKQIEKLNSLLSRRCQHEPLAYIRGKSEFYGREFIVSPAVLEPRPETETMIDNLKWLVTKNKPSLRSKSKIHVADIGCGNGALGITSALEIPYLNVDLIDISEDAIKVAKQNLKKFHLDLKVTQSDLLKNVSNHYQILLCNLPYIANGFRINQAAQREPKLAIFGGHDGLRIYYKLFKMLNTLNYSPVFVLTESLPPQHLQLTRIASKFSYQVIKDDDFIQIFRHHNF